MTKTKILGKKIAVLLAAIAMGFAVGGASACTPNDCYQIEQGTFHSLVDVYNDGRLTREEVKNISYHFNGGMVRSVRRGTADELCEDTAAAWQSCECLFSIFPFDRETGIYYFYHHEYEDFVPQSKGELSEEKRSRIKQDYLLMLQSGEHYRQMLIFCSDQTQPTRYCFGYCNNPFDYSALTIEDIYISDYYGTFGGYVALRITFIGETWFVESFGSFPPRPRILFNWVVGDIGFTISHRSAWIKIGEEPFPTTHRLIDHTFITLWRAE